MNKKAPANNDLPEGVHELNLDALVVEDGEGKPTVCRLCGAILEYRGLGEYGCPDCGHLEYDAYGVVRAFLEKFPRSNVIQIEKATGVSRHKINRMIADGRFTASDGLLSPGQKEEPKPVKKSVYVNSNSVEASRMWSKDLRS